MTFYMFEGMLLAKRGMIIIVACEWWSVLQIVFIGISAMQETEIRTALDYCLLTSDEVLLFNL